MHEFFNDWRNIMGMICYYFRADEDMMKKIRERGVHIIFSEKYEKNLLNIEKTWDAIQYVLRKTQFETKEDEYVRHLISGGEMVNEEDLGYGPASYFTKEQTVRLNNILNKWDKEMFRKNFHIKSMLEDRVYPLRNDEEEEEFFSYIWAGFSGIKQIFEEAAREGEYVITFIS